MTLEKFILEYDTAGDKDRFLSSCVKNEYVNFDKKCDVCDRIVSATCYLSDGETKRFRINSCLRYCLFVLNIILLYTNIEFDISQGLRVYDELNKRNIINKLVLIIDKNEYDEFSTLLSMKFDDEIENTRAFASVVDNKMESVGYIIDKIISEYSSKNE